MNGIKVTLLILTLMHVLPIVITQLLILEYPFDDWENGIRIKRISTAANVFLNCLVLLLVILAYYRETKLNIIEVLNFECSYQDISRSATSNIICLVIAILIGVGEYACLCVYYQDQRFFRFSSKYILLFSFAAIPIILGYYYGYSGTSNLAINEICRKATIIDTTEYSWDEDVSYVTIINNGAFSCELDQMYLSDKENELQARSLQGGVIKPSETYRHFMSGNDSLNIKKNGGTIVYLSDKFGTVIDKVEIPALQRDESYRSMETGWKVVNWAKEETDSVIVHAPSFSKESGFYDDAFELELIASPETTIYYTIDSSNPTIESMKYSQPVYVYDRSKEENLYRSIRNARRDYLDHPSSGLVPVDKCFVVRAVAVDNDGNCSDIVTKSYFIDQEEYKDGMVISLVSDPDGLFGDEYGICVTGKAYDEWYLDAYTKMAKTGEGIDTSNMPAENYFQEGKDWERESSFEVFENSNLLLAQQVGIRVQGHSARVSEYKRFSIYARDEYSASEYFNLNLINEYNQHAMMLRQGDLYAISQILGQNRDVATIEFRPVVVFLDGEFWYTTYLYEKFNENNFSQKYNLSKGNIVMVKNGESTDNLDAGKTPFSNLFTKANDLADNENYLKYNEILDIQSYIDSCCINVFLQNTDYQEQWNNLFWHTEIFENEQEGDTRWRLGLYDMDLGWGSLKEEFGEIPDYEINPFTMYGEYQPGPITEWLIYSALRENDIFCRQFVLTFMDLINTNFSVDNTMAIMEKLGIKDEGYQKFFENRIAYIVPFMAAEFELAGTQETVILSSNVSGMPITLNTITPELSRPNADDYGNSDFSSPYIWSGTYFTDYPVTVTADDPKFSHWEVTVNGNVQKYTDTKIEVPVPKGGVQIHAVFK